MYEDCQLSLIKSISYSLFLKYIQEFFKFSQIFFFTQEICSRIVFCNYIFFSRKMLKKIVTKKKCLLLIVDNRFEVVPLLCRQSTLSVLFSWPHISIRSIIRDISTWKRGWSLLTKLYNRCYL